MELHKYTVYLGLTGSLFGYVKHPIFRRIEELGESQNGLPFGSGTAPSAGTLAIATQVASKAISLGFSELDAFPGRNGEVTIAIYLGELDHSFQVRPNSSLRYLKESDPDSEVEVGLSLTDVTQKITDIAQAHLSSNLYFGTVATGIFEVRPSRIPVTAMEYPSLMSIVYGARSADAYAAMLASSTELLAQSRRHSGNLTNQPCLMAAGMASRGISEPDSPETGDQAAFNLTENWEKDDDLRFDVLVKKEALGELGLEEAEELEQLSNKRDRTVARVPNDDLLQERMRNKALTELQELLEKYAPLFARKR